MVVSTRTVVVFPAPLGPRSPYTVPRATSRSIPSRAKTSPKRFRKPCTRIAGSVMSTPSRHCFKASSYLGRKLLACLNYSPGGARIGVMATRGASTKEDLAKDVWRQLYGYFQRHRDVVQ